MIELIKKLTSLNAAPGEEDAVRDFIISEIAPHCEYSVDALGSITAFKKGKNRANKKVMFSCHMDEVALIITHITAAGYLKFETLGGIDTLSLLSTHVVANGIDGIIGYKPIHLQGKADRDKIPEISQLYIDIGAKSEEEAKNLVTPGDTAYFVSDFYEMGTSCIKAKALDDRVGCAIMVDMLKSELPFDTYFCFNVQEEVGLRGSKCTAFAGNYDIGIVLEATTASDTSGVDAASVCCSLGAGAVVPFMDGRTLYDKKLYDLAFETARENNIKIQTKNVIAGGNDASSVQTAGSGCRVLSISLPCRYIHTPSSVANKEDITEMRRLIDCLLEKLYD